ncbi:hypothetical protein ACN27E_04935 [Mycobacterium sp. WMMD1722]
MAVDVLSCDAGDFDTGRHMMLIDGHLNLFGDRATLERPHEAR